MSNMFTAEPYGLRGFLIVAIAAVVLIWPIGSSAKNTVLHSFCSQSNCADGAEPVATVIADPAGDVFGTTSSGPFGEGGTIFELKRNSDTGKYSFRRLYSFCSQSSCADGEYPNAPLIMDTNGNLYGTAQLGGSSGAGAVFELIGTGKNRKLRILHTFCLDGGFCADGRNPVGLTYDGAAHRLPYDGTSPLYGIAMTDGVNVGGVAYQLNPIEGTAKWALSVVYTFCSQQNCADGHAPANGLLIDRQGDLYGSTSLGGAKDSGVAFRLSREHRKWTESVLYDFCSVKQCPDSSPSGPFAMDGTGSLLGINHGGKNRGGALFRLVPGALRWEYSALYNFCAAQNCTDGADPGGILTLDKDGNIFGTATSGGRGNPLNGGGGAVFEFGAGALLLPYLFCAKENCADGAEPSGGVIIDSANNLMGTTFIGGTNGAGTVFSLPIAN